MPVKLLFEFLEPLLEFDELHHALSGVEGKCLQDLLGTFVRREEPVVLPILHNAVEGVVDVVQDLLEYAVEAGFLVVLVRDVISRRVAVRRNRPLIAIVDRRLVPRLFVIIRHLACVGVCAGCSFQNTHE